MRVLQIVQYFQIGGLEQMVYLLASGCERIGVKCDVLAYVEDGALRAKFESSGVRTFFREGGGGRRWDLPAALGLRMISGRYDLVHSHHLGPLFYSAGPAALMGLPHVHTEHSVEFYDNPRRRVMARLLARRVRFVGVTRQIASWHQENLGSEVQVIENGVEVPTLLDAEDKQSRRRALGLDPDGFIVGCVARLAPEKRLDTLLEATALLRSRSKPMTLVVVGEGGERQELESMAGKLGIGSHVRWLGSRSDVNEILPTFDVIALSSAREGLPLSLLEGMAHGLPAVATDVGGIPLLLKNGGGLVVPADRPDHLAEALELYMTDGQRRAKDGGFARDLIAQEYSVEQMVRGYGDLYEKCVRNGGHRRWTGSSLGTILGLTRRPPSIWR